MEYFKKKIEELTEKKIEKEKKNPSKENNEDLTKNEKVVIFKKIIHTNIIPMIRTASSIVGRAGCSIKFYSNEEAEIRDLNKRIYIQILFYPRNESRLTLGVNAPFLQFAYSPSKKNIKITSKISIKSDEPRVKIDEIEIDRFIDKKIEKYILDFMTIVLK